MKLIKKGKVKEIYDLGDGTLEFLFTDQISVFDKIVPTKIPHKGETLCRTSEFWFKKTKDFGIRSHFIKRTAVNRMIVEKVDIISDYSKLNTKTKNYLIPLEVICRHYISGSLYDRMIKQDIVWKDLGFRNIPKYGDKLYEPLFEVTTKLEKIDRRLEEKDALRISGITKKEFENIKETVLKIDTQITNNVKHHGLIHVDGKKEFAFDGDRELMVVDTYGTADEDRFWDANEYADGRCIELSKEFVRQYFKETGYYSELMTARESGKKEPDISSLPIDKVDTISGIYINLFERITGENFR